MDDTIDVLGQQHYELLDQLDLMAERLAGLAMPLLEFLAYLEREMETHCALEERALYPILARQPELATGALPIMEQEHAIFRTRLGELADALRYGTVASQVGAVEGIIDLLRSHIAKEDTVLFTLARATLSTDERQEVDCLAQALR